MFSLTRSPLASCTQTIKKKCTSVFYKQHTAHIRYETECASIHDLKIKL